MFLCACACRLSFPPLKCSHDGSKCRFVSDLPPCENKIKCNIPTKNRHTKAMRVSKARVCCCCCSASLCIIRMSVQRHLRRYCRRNSANNLNSSIKCRGHCAAYRRDIASPRRMPTRHGGIGSAGVRLGGTKRKRYQRCNKDIYLSSCRLPARSQGEMFQTRLKAAIEEANAGIGVQSNLEFE
jgi:hypothetical protein